MDSLADRVYGSGAVAVALGSEQPKDLMPRPWSLSAQCILGTYLGTIIILLVLFLATCWRLVVSCWAAAKASGLFPRGSIHRSVINTLIWLGLCQRPRRIHRRGGGQRKRDKGRAKALEAALADSLGSATSSGVWNHDLRGSQGQKVKVEALAGAKEAAHAPSLAEEASSDSACSDTCCPVTPEPRSTRGNRRTSSISISSSSSGSSSPTEAHRCSTSSSGIGDQAVSSADSSSSVGGAASVAQGKCGARRGADKQVVGKGTAPSARCSRRASGPICLGNKGASVVEAATPPPHILASTSCAPRRGAVPTVSFTSAAAYAGYAAHAYASSTAYLEALYCRAWLHCGYASQAYQTINYLLPTTRCEDKAQASSQAPPRSASTSSERATSMASTASSREAADSSGSMASSTMHCSSSSNEGALRSELHQLQQQVNTLRTAAEERDAWKAAALASQEDNRRLQEESARLKAQLAVLQHTPAGQAAPPASHLVQRDNQTLQQGMLLSAAAPVVAPPPSSAVVSSHADSTAWPTPAQADSQAQQQTLQIKIEKLTVQVSKQKAAMRAKKQQVGMLQEQMHLVLEQHQQQVAVLDAALAEAGRDIAHRDLQLEDLQARLRVYQSQQNPISGFADQVNSLVARKRPGVAIRFIPRRDLHDGMQVAGGAGRNGGVTWGWVECVSQPTDRTRSAPLQRYYMPAVAKVYRPGADNELHMAIEADWAGGVRFYGLFEVEDDPVVEEDSEDDSDDDDEEEEEEDSISTTRWMLVWQDAGICLQDLFKGNKPEEFAYSQVPAKQRAVLCADVAAQLQQQHTFAANLDVKLENMVVASLEAVMQGVPALKLIDGDTSRTALALEQYQWRDDGGGGYLRKPVCIGTPGYAAALMALKVGFFRPEVLDAIHASKHVPSQVKALLSTALQTLTPQQALQCDLFSACVVLWELLTGCRLWHEPDIRLWFADPAVASFPVLHVWRCISAGGILRYMRPLLRGASQPAMDAARALAKLVAAGLHSQGGLLSQEGTGVTLQQLQAAAEALAARLPLSLPEVAGWEVEEAPSSDWALYGV